MKKIVLSDGVARKMVYPEFRRAAERYASQYFEGRQLKDSYLITYMDDQHVTLQGFALCFSDEGPYVFVW